jgi:hypothetical protein
LGLNDTVSGRHESQSDNRIMILYADNSTLLYNVVAIQYIVNREESYIC